MARPVTTPCIPCGRDTLHVFEIDTLSWKCNTCGNIKRTSGGMRKKTVLDEFMRRSYGPRANTGRKRRPKSKSAGAAAMVVP